MSLRDDQNAQIEAKLDRAWLKSQYGRTYSPAFEVAQRIKDIRDLLAEKEKGNSEAELNSFERQFLTQTAGILLIAALTETEKLHEIARALGTEPRVDARQANILKAYAECIQDRYPPTFVELKQAFVRRFGEECWPENYPDYPVRKTLNILGLPLRRAKPGPRIGSRIKLGNRKAKRELPD